jgi:pullulanase/glycogen debranching enzyme
MRHARALVALSSLAVVVACGGGGGGGGTQPQTNGDLAFCDGSDFQQVLSKVPAAPAEGGSTTTSGSTTVRIHYHRDDGAYSGWQTYVYNAPGEALGGWPGANPTGSDTYGAYWDVPVTTASFNFIIHNGDSNREPSGWASATGDQQQFWSVADGKEVWKIAGDKTNYTSNPLTGGTPDITTVRVHYKRFDGAYSNWGLHLWSGNGLNAAALPAGVTIGDWSNPVPLSSMANYAVGSGEVVFDIPVLNPKDSASNPTSLQFIIHSIANPNDKDGRSDNITVNYGALSIVSQVGNVWLVQQDPTVYPSAPDTRSASSTDSRAYWLTKSLIQWPHVDTSGVFKLYYSKTAQIGVAKDAKVAGADGFLTLKVGGTVPSAASDRFKYVSPGVVLSVQDADVSKLAGLHTNELVVVQEDSSGKVQNATTLQIAGAMDDLYAAAANETALGATISGGNTSFKLWAPTAQQVKLCSYDSGSGQATAIDAMTQDPATGIWSIAKTGDLSGKYYTYVVDVFVRGVGIVRNRVTDPYSLSLTTDSKRSYVANLDSASLKPSSWDSDTAPTTTKAQEDMVVYELHVRDFSANDSTVTAANRGKYLAFTESGSNGMKHLAALAQAGLTDVHLLPSFDFATVPESGCVTPDTSSSKNTDTTARDAIAKVADTDCFNWGYDPFHYTAPEGSYASDASDGAKRIVEFRSMVQSLHKIGLRVGMDVVYNHTSASGQDEHSVLDRIVPGYYQRLGDTGSVLNDTCCADTASENMMMGKLLIDSVTTWATKYDIDSFRFDLMGFQPRSVMEQLKTTVDAATGRDVYLIGEGWNYGAVANGARFVQASQLSLNGSGIGTFSDRARDRIRGGGCCDSGDAFRTQGYVTGLYFDPNDIANAPTKDSLLEAADMIRVGLAGSIRSFSFVTRDDSTKTAEQIPYGSDPAGYVTDPQEVVNYFENHDNRTFYDAAVAKLPKTTSLDDRVRVQMLAAAINAFSQGVAYYHAGVDTLRSKSFDGNSYNSGDWFNRLDWSYTSNNFAVGLAPGSATDDTLAKTFLDASVAANYTPATAQITKARDVFRDLLKIRSSSTLFRMRTGDDIKARLTFPNTGSSQVATVLVGHLDGSGYTGANFQEVMYFVNVDKTAQSVTVASEVGKSWELHPVQADASAADAVAKTATFDSTSGKFTIPARSAVVYVVK